MFGLAMHGILTGFFLGFASYGTIFFMLIKIGMQYGFRKGALFELGHVLSLILIVTLVQFSMLQVNQIALFKQIFSIVGGIILIGYGVYTLNTSKSADLTELNKKIPNHKYILQGFVLNIINPFEFILWLGILGTLNVTYHYDSTENFMFCVIALSSMAFIDLCKVFLAKQIRKYLTVNVLRIFYKIIAIILIAIGIFLIFYFFFLIK